MEVTHVQPGRPLRVPLVVRVPQVGNPWPTVSSDETLEQSEDVVHSFLTTSLRFPESDLAKISFANVHRLPKHTSALQSCSTSYPQLPAIVVRFLKMKDRNMISKLAARARQFKKNITKHLPRSMQEQRKSLLRKASKLFASGKQKALNTVFMLMVRRSYLTC